jgi:nitroimidazol reductase NimA-like FMN-containing flavoprotein (pyridoxamine 5'-phosphate oxidase superfamily)
MADVPPDVEERITSEPLMAHLATCVDGRPHVAPVWYEYDDGALDVLTGGRKLANIRENSRVAVSIQKDEDGHTEWMVTFLGTATVVDDADATREATRRINAKYDAPSDAYAENELVRIDVGSVTHRSY